MQKVLLLIVSLLVTAPAFSAGSDENGDTICYVYHQGRLLDKMNCHYEGYSSGNIERSVGSLTYQLPKYGEMTVYQSTNFGKNYGQENNIKSYTHLINNERAVTRYRSPKSLALVNRNKINSGRQRDLLECHLSIETQWELCI